MPALLFIEYHNAYVDEVLVTSKTEIAKSNNEGIDNVPGPVYSCNVSEGELVRRMLIEYIKTRLLDHFAT